MSKALMLFADGFETVEALMTVDILRRGGVEVTMASIYDSQEVTSAQEVTIKTDSILKNVNIMEYDAIILPGGQPGTTTLGQSPDVKLAVMAMNGVGSTLGPQLIAEIGDVTRFVKRGSLTAFAGVDPGKNDSGKHSQKSVPTSKKGSPHLRKTLFQIMDSLIQRSPADDPVYAFMDKKRAQGKPYYVYMTAGANKFLRIYYGRVNEYLSTLSEGE